MQCQNTHMSCVHLDTRFQGDGIENIGKDFDYLKGTYTQSLRKKNLNVRIFLCIRSTALYKTAPNKWSSRYLIEKINKR